MKSVVSKLNTLVHEAYIARIGAELNAPVAEAVFAGHRTWIEETIATAIAEATAEMDAATRERYETFMLEQLDRDLGRLRTSGADPLSDAIHVRIEVSGERRP